MDKQDSVMRMRYIGKSGFYGLKRLKIYDVRLASMYGRIWVEAAGSVISYRSLTMFFRNWADARKGGTV